MSDINSPQTRPRTRSSSPLKKKRVPGTTIPMSLPELLEEDPFAIDFGQYVTEIARLQKLVDRSDIGGENILEALDVTKQHFNRRDRILEGFLRCLGEECKVHLFVL